MQPGSEPQYGPYPVTALTPASSDQSINGDGTISSKKRKESPLPTGKKPVKKAKADTKKDSVNPEQDGEPLSKAKRVRTGCLTCRERHLKCDEGLPVCNNCRKSNRECKRGVRLNFIDIWAERPPTLLTAFGTSEWKVNFLDESREIASEYQGGLQLYRRPRPQQQQQQQQQRDPPKAVPMDPRLTFEYAQPAPPAPNMAHQPLPQMHGNMQNPYPEPPPAPELGNMYDPFFKQDQHNHHLQPPPSGSTVESRHSGNSDNSSLHPGSVGSYNVGPNGVLQTSNEERKDYIDDQEETLFMQVFVEEVGLWMDSMDSHKHFSQLLPFHSLSEPMLLNAFLACGARHLQLVNPAYNEEKALHYYDTATRHLLKNLQDPNRDTVICATTAVILNVYEIMSERALQRMNHIAGARALIKECGWNARSTGVGAACFWLNVGLEVLSCLHFNWQAAWDPDDWGVDMDFSRELQNGREEIWTHRMLYIIAKVCNYRATTPRYKEGEDPKLKEMRTQQRYEEWLRLRDMADAWNNGIPRTMHPIAFLYPHQTATRSNFPEVWLIKRSTVVARLFYHTAQLLLSQTNPYYSPTNSPEMADMQSRHSQMICGISAHVKDRGVASVAIRSLAHAAEVLTQRNEQEEVLRVFSKINKETGWKVGYVYKELKEKWGWEEQMSAEEYAQTHEAARLQREAKEARERQMQENAMLAQQQQQSFDFNAQQSNGMGTLQPNVQPSGPPMMNPATSNPGGGGGSGGAGGGGGGGGMPRKMPQGIPNPMYAKADFNLPQHPYQNFYVAPNHVSAAWGDGGGNGSEQHNQQHNQGQGQQQQFY
ncbi:uncharacterized protein LTR77_009231 [Saxophila tyrrhenica]|uniref:Zn(2)-C6 fungal-type domain-containing protein n=1 Tax=Saxophila tyrrhenica TaxID=1690608 RepID=A0AAV9NYH4_9PEZI|nr:hypothetical protein LTR77_009231 [Saxophila tyrrhenica]